MTQQKNDAPAELTPEEIAAVAGGNGLLRSGGGRSDGGALGSGVG